MLLSLLFVLDYYIISFHYIFSLCYAQYLASYIYSPPPNLLLFCSLIVIISSPMALLPAYYPYYSDTAVFVYMSQ